VDTAVAAGSFKTLARLLTDADLIGVMKGPGPFTVFAPTDEAFAKVPKDVLDGLVRDKAKLQEVLKYHVRQAGHLRGGGRGPHRQRRQGREAERRLLERHGPRDRRRPAAAAVAGCPRHRAADW